MSTPTAIAFQGVVPMLLTPQEVGEILGVNRGALRDLRDRGSGPRYYTIGAAIRYHRNDVDEWRADRRDLGR
ncbi:MAG: helix-turn-helix domain-containing protein [Pseudolysinimonas sp.]|uniref:helix-turn-helix domain-containing protein n=1 Tax=Pseudolysinimonas sp. TaxID=2680009 RepID=UPI003267464D